MEKSISERTLYLILPWLPEWWILLSLLLLLIILSLFVLRYLQKRGASNRKGGDIYLIVDNQEITREIINLIKERAQTDLNARQPPLNKLVVTTTQQTKDKLLDKAGGSSTNPDQQKKPPTEEEVQFIRKVEEYIERHLTDPRFNIQQLCQYLGMSHSNLHRKLKALTGRSASQMIKAAKIARAKSLLDKPNLTITAVAYDSGFSDPDYFHRVFKQEVGLTPTQYREGGRDEG